MKKYKAQRLSTEVITEQSYNNRIIAATCVSALLAYIIFLFSFQNAFVPSGSMLPTLNVGEVIFATKVHSYSTIERDDIVVFSPQTANNGDMYFSDEMADSYFVKRVIGLPGDRIRISNGLLYVNDEVVESSYTADAFIVNDFDEVTVPDGCYFMMGDNRNHSQDSRYIGCIPRGNIISKSVFHYNSVTGVVLKAAYQSI